MNELKLMNKETANFDFVQTANGTKAVANYTEDNVYTAFTVLNEMTDKADYVRCVLLKIVLDACGDDKKLIAETKKKLVSEYRFKSTSVIDKLYKVATHFITVDDDLLIAEINHSVLHGTVEDVDGTDKDVSAMRNDFNLKINTKAVHALKDKFGFEFSVSALQELLWLKDSNDNIDIDKITELIAEGKLKASMPSQNMKTGVRGLVTSLKPKALETSAQSTTDGTDGTDKAQSTKQSVQYETTSNKTKAVAIQTVINSIDDEVFTSSEFVQNFVAFLTEYIKNTK